MFNPPHPGEILKELYINPIGFTVTEVAKSLNVTRKTLSSLINERSGVSSEMALRLSKAFSNTTPEYWLNLQQQYDIWCVRQKLDTSHIKALLPITHLTDRNTTNNTNHLLG